MRIIAIGDIHGMYFKLIELMNTISPSKEDKIIFMGDYIDRGPDSKQVLDYVISMIEDGFNVIPLKGNHEDMFINYLRKDEVEDGLFLYNGGRKTIESYRKVNNGKFLLPKKHRQFLDNLKLYHEEEFYFFVHAGVSPNVNPSQVDSDDALWIREDFIWSDNNWGKVIVFGHTIQSDGPLIMHNKRGIDTGAFSRDKLTAMVIDEGREKFIIV